jgi:transposase
MVMAAKHSKKKKQTSLAPEPKPDAAGIDIGSSEMWVAIDPDRDERPIRCYGSFTEDLHELADWLKDRNIRTVAMESTGVYWIPLFQILESRGFEVCLVNAHYPKFAPGRKSDVIDCQWLQYLHSVGLLSGSFRPPQSICEVRAILRHRENLIALAASHVQRIQKSLNQMNLLLHNVISDIVGKTGLAILDAILDGQRDPRTLAKLRDRRIKASEENIMKSLVGDYRAEHLFTLKQSLSTYRHHLLQIDEADVEIKKRMAALDSRCLPAPSVEEVPVKRGPGRPKGSKSADSQLRTELHRIIGTDLTLIPGIDVTTVQTILSEVGPDLSAFRSAPAFVSWLRLCPNNQITGGKVIATKTQPTKNRLSHALRMGAQSLVHSQSALGGIHRRFRARLGPPDAITASAHRLARIIYHLVSTRKTFDDSVFNELEKQDSQRKEQRLKAQARAGGFKLVPLEA